MVMKSDVGRLCDIKSLRELRKARRANEAVKMSAVGRVKSGIDGMFSFGRLLALLAQRYAPENVRRIVGMVFRKD